ncbi:BMP-binding endothelial regulator protein-like [Limulus polyphemus]|uniref:BMP-binding endothelial regulator protein-like n=1 Tax=Limulus polyphemus TaxID=6850 RepID=A0ABM1SYB1_LIMPO|nr:BMP-binding endothelial regulator protein-like [Limulus polyphemus]
MFSCQSGVVTEAMIHCHVPCRNHQPPVAGECCPSCKGCTLGGRTYSDNEEIEVTQADPCVQCSCKKGNIACIKTVCPVLPCPEYKYTIKPGECCPSCKGNRKFNNFNGSCLVGMTLIKHEQTMVFDRCTNCTCKNSTTICQRTVCPPVHCPPDFQEFLPNQCCYRCREPEESKATCGDGGRIYQDGESWKKERCTTCSCKDGKVMCAALECFRQSCPKRHKLKTLPGVCCPTCVEEDGVCSVFGDPHYRTFDGRIFTFQGSCKYLLTNDCKGNKSFSIQVINDPRHTKTFSWTKVVKIKVGESKIRMARFMKVKINKKKVQLPYVKLGSFSIVQEGYNIVTRTNLGIKMMWDGGSFLEVSVPPEFKNQMCGLCGNYNGDSKDDFITRNGNVVSDVDIFGNDWKRGRERRCKPLVSTKARDSSCGHNWESRIRGIQECNVLKVASVFHRCHSQVDPMPYYQSCLIDMCECPLTERCYCEALHAYARECERAGIVLNWRKNTGCENVYCPKGAVFTTCGTACKRTCRNYRQNKPCRRRCKPGCICPAGTVLQKNRCVSIEKCYP